MDADKEKLKMLRMLVAYAASGDEGAYRKAERQYATRFIRPEHLIAASDEYDACRESCCLAFMTPAMRDASLADAKKRLARIEAAKGK